MNSIIKIFIMIISTLLNGSSYSDLRILNNTNRVFKRNASNHWPSDTIAYASYESKILNVQIKINLKCISMGREGALFVNRLSCDKWNVTSQSDGFLLIANKELGEYLTADKKGNVFTTIYKQLSTIPDSQLWFIGSNVKSTRLFNKYTKEYLDINQYDRIITSPWYGKFKKSSRIYSLKNTRDILNIDTN